MNPEKTEPIFLRNCYCSLRAKDPTFFEKHNIPEGFCGFCEKCRKPGHTRHFPGAVPYTGSWCDTHYLLISLIHPLGNRSVFVVAILLTAAWFVFRKLFLI